MTPFITTVLTLGAACALSVSGGVAAQASHSYDGGWDGGGDTFRAVSYINPDTGAATANPDVDPGSSCATPDRYDSQKFSDAGATNRNVHNDACFLDDRGTKVGRGIGATYELRGVGYISACPDPDLGGPEFARLTDINGDGRHDRCVQSSYQDRGALGVADVAGDFEYHARINDNTATTGDSDVKWGLDRDLNGLDYRGTNDAVRISWSATGTSSGGTWY